MIMLTACLQKLPFKNFKIRQEDSNIYSGFNKTCILLLYDKIWIVSWMGTFTTKTNNFYKLWYMSTVWRFVNSIGFDFSRCKRNSRELFKIEIKTASFWNQSYPRIPSICWMSYFDDKRNISQQIPQIKLQCDNMDESICF